MKINLTSRVKRINWLYSHYLTNYNFEEIKNLYNDLSLPEEEFVKKTLLNKNYLENKLIENIKDSWSWDRINVLLKAILLNGSSEIIYYKNKKDIVISEHNKIVKTYIGDEKMISFVNAVLDKID